MYLDLFCLRFIFYLLFALHGKFYIDTYTELLMQNTLFLLADMFMFHLIRDRRGHGFKTY